MSEGTHRVQHEEVEAGAGAQGHQGGAAVQSVACTHNVVARLEGIFVCRLLFRNLKAAPSQESEETVQRQTVYKKLSLSFSQMSSLNPEVLKETVWETNIYKSVFGFVF